MTGHNPAESTNACLTSPTTDIQPELPLIRYALEWRNENSNGEWKRSGTGGFSVPGNQHAKRFMYDRDAAVFEMGVDNARWVAGTEHRVVQITETVVAEVRHGTTTHLTSTTPILGDVVMVPREPTQAMLDATCATDADDEAMRATWKELLSAAPASPIPTSVANEGEPLLAREIAAQFYDKRDPLDQSFRDVAHNIRRGRLDDQDAVELVRFTLAHAALSPALDNTAVEVEALRANRDALEYAIERMVQLTPFRANASDAQDLHISIRAIGLSALEASPGYNERPGLLNTDPSTVQTEKAR